MLGMIALTVFVLLFAVYGAIAMRNRSWGYAAAGFAIALLLVAANCIGNLLNYYQSISLYLANGERGYPITHDDFNFIVTNVALVTFGVALAVMTILALRRRYTRSAPVPGKSSGSCTISEGREA